MSGLSWITYLLGVSTKKETFSKFTSCSRPWSKIFRWKMLRQKCSYRNDIETHKKSRSKKKKKKKKKKNKKIFEKKKKKKKKKNRTKVCNLRKTSKT